MVEKILHIAQYFLICLINFCTKIVVTFDLVA